MKLTRVFESIMELCLEEPGQDFYPGLQFLERSHGTMYFVCTDPKALGTLVSGQLGDTQYIPDGYLYTDGTKGKFVKCRRCWEFKDPKKKLIAVIRLA